LRRRANAPILRLLQSIGNGRGAMAKDRRSGTGFERVEVTSRAGLRAWLEANHARNESVWLVTYKKAAGEAYVPYDAVVEEALCFGWVDSLPRKLDADRSMLLLSPRKPGSAWSAANKARVEALAEAGLLAAPGLAKIEAAKADGAWTRLDGVERLEIPPDLAAALAALPTAAENFAGFPRSVRRGILEWILQAKRPETRAKRIAETSRLAAENLRANQFRQPGARRRAGAD
jgi:uncharacterized protein YdeI (YjbR/CyaY-like superfamily)